MFSTLFAGTKLRENSQKSQKWQNLKPPKFSTFKVIQRHENDVTYTIKSISQPEKVCKLHRNMLMAVNNTLQTVDETQIFTLRK